MKKGKKRKRKKGGGKGQKDSKKEGESLKGRNGRGGGNWVKEFKMINVVVFCKYKKIVHESNSIMNDAACKISLGVHTMSASEASPACTRRQALRNLGRVAH
jgi:hypothetical protein